MDLAKTGPFLAFLMLESSEQENDILFQTYYGGNVTHNQSIPLPPRDLGFLTRQKGTD